MKRSPLKRKTPLKVKRTTVCNKLDALAREFCKRVQKCEAHHFDGECAGNLEWCHLKTRSHKGIRHNPLNFICMCSRHHRLFTSHPDWFYNFIEENYPGRWQRLNDLLIEAKEKNLKPDYDYWLEFYRRAA